MCKYTLVLCPWCSMYIIIMKEEFNCKIFRHGVLKSNHTQIDPHLNKQDCDRLVRENLIYGCGKPYQLVEKNNIWIAEKCDYI